MKEHGGDAMKPASDLALDVAEKWVCGEHGYATRLIEADRADAVAPYVELAEAAVAMVNRRKTIARFDGFIDPLEDLERSMRLRNAGVEIGMETELELRFMRATYVVAELMKRDGGGGG